jgi:hypothetical protein
MSRYLPYNFADPTTGPIFRQLSVLWLPIPPSI